MEIYSTPLHVMKTVSIVKYMPDKMCLSLIEKDVSTNKRDIFNIFYHYPKGYRKYAELNAA